MFAVFVTVLGFISVSHAFRLPCAFWLQPLGPIDLQFSEGRWVAVAASMKDPAAEKATQAKGSIAIDFYNSSYTQAESGADNKCQYHHHNVSVEDNIMTMKVDDFNFTATFFYPPCMDCSVFTLDIQSPSYKSKQLILLSKRRELEQREMEIFRAQVQCLNMPPPIVMDPTKELCPEQPISDPALQTEEKTQEQQDKVQ